MFSLFLVINYCRGKKHIERINKLQTLHYSWNTHIGFLAMTFKLQPPWNRKIFNTDRLKKIVTLSKVISLRLSSRDLPSLQQKVSLKEIASLPLRVVLIERYFSSSCNHCPPSPWRAGGSGPFFTQDSREPIAYLWSVDHSQSLSVGTNCRGRGDDISRA